jgi:uncharacterized protein (TIRG00374 family)
MEIKKYKKWLIVSLIISVTSLTIIFMLSSTEEAVGIIFTLSPLIILLAILFNFLAWIFWTFRIMVLASALGCKLSFRKAFKIVMVNLFVAAVTPSSIGGEPMRIYMLSQESMTNGNMAVGDATALTIGERVIDFIYFGIALPLMLVFLGLSVDLKELQYLLLGVAVLLALGGFFLFYIVTHPHKLKGKFGKLEGLIKIFVKDKDKRKDTMDKIEKEFWAFSQSTLVIFKQKKLYFLATLGLTAMMWSFGFLIPSLLLLGFGLEPMWALSYMFQMIIVFITMIPISPGGSGLAEFSAYILYGQKIPTEYVGPLVLVWRILTFYMNLFGGLIYTLHYIAKGK